jgi:hypothetical protein
MHQVAVDEELPNTLHAAPCPGGQIIGGANFLIAGTIRPWPETYRLVRPERSDWSWFLTVEGDPESAELGYEEHPGAVVMAAEADVSEAATAASRLLLAWWSYLRDAYEMEAPEKISRGTLMSEQRLKELARKVWEPA